MIMRGRAPMGRDALPRAASIVVGRSGQRATTAALQSINIARAAATPSMALLRNAAQAARGAFAESTMLVNCAAYQDGRKLADIPVADISEYVIKPDCFVWVALVDPTQEELDEMAAEFGLHPLAIEDARKGHQRPK